MNVNPKVLEGLEHVHRFPLSSRNVNISLETPYNLIYRYQTIILAPLILFYELKNTKPMPSLTDVERERDNIIFLEFYIA